MRDTTERPEGVAAGTALLTGPNAATIEQHATRLLSDEAAYRSMATARNPYGDGYAAERIVENIRRYFAASTLAPSMVPDRAELDKAGAASAAKTAAATEAAAQTRPSHPQHRSHRTKRAGAALPPQRKTRLRWHHRMKT